jgi:uncharacterized repeat protein (TIGR01451 family)
VVPTVPTTPALPSVPVVVPTVPTLPTLPTPSLPTLPTIPVVTLPPLEVQTCTITANQTTVVAGQNVSLTWDTSGFDQFFLNGQQLSGESGITQITNILRNTTYTLVAKTADGKSDCVATVTITCLPAPVPVGDCRLSVNKTVDRQSARIGDTLTYTITAENIGTTSCGNTSPTVDPISLSGTYLDTQVYTGGIQSIGGVKVEDVVNDKLSYLNHSITSTHGLAKASYNAGTRTLSVNGGRLTPGQKVTLTWTGKVSQPSSCGAFEIPNQARASAPESNTWAYSPTVKTAIGNDCVVPTPNPTPICDSFTASPNTITTGGASTLTWNTSNASRVTISTVGDVVVDGSKSVTPTTNTTYRLTAFGTDNRSVTCDAIVNVTIPPTPTPDPAPTCDSFTASPNTITTGGASTLTWNTSNASRVVINNGVGDVFVDGSKSVAPLANTIYRLTAFGTQDRSVTCDVPVNVTTVSNPQNTVPVCESFTATPNQLPANGGTVTFAWKVARATNVTIDPTIGAVASEGSRSLTVTQGATYTLTASDADGDKVTCAAPVTVATSNPTPVLSCSSNVVFTASDYSVNEGEATTLNWTTNNVDTVSVSSINATGLSGSYTVEPTSNTTYTLTATKGTQSISCPVTIAVEENRSNGGGGGGGSSSPKCNLSVSDNNISAGDRITLKWDTSRASEVTIKDNHGKTVMTTEKYKSADKKEYYDGSITLKPTRDTEYTLTAERGSKDRTCKVKVNVDDLTVIESRDQKPLVAGISLDAVPYTGFEAGPVLTALFYTLLAAWALFVSYLIVARRQSVTEGVHLSAVATPSFSPAMQQAQDIRPDVFATSISVAPLAPKTIPTNLPVGTPVVGYENVVTPVASHTVTDAMVATLENYAHEQKALLSSDALRYFISTTKNEAERMTALTTVITKAKGTFPLEDGWIVINEARMQALCDICNVEHVASEVAPFVPAVVPEGSSSLAEAIVTGNIVAAYDMIGNRPMFALADAAADFDAVVRARRGEVVTISQLLTNETARLSESQLKNVIAALTSALDGTYTDEASAVKMAIMKAVKEVA